MKKLLLILLCVVTLAVLCACGKKAANNAAVSPDYVRTETDEAPTEAPEAAAPAAAPAAPEAKVETVIVSDEGDNVAAFDAPAGGSAQSSAASATSGDNSKPADNEGTFGQADEELSDWSNYY